MSALDLDFALETSRGVQDDFIVVEVVDGVAEGAVVHRPAPERMWRSGFPSRIQIQTFADRVVGSFPPEWWPSACGRVERGSIYNRGGPFERSTICPLCEGILATPRHAPHLRRASREALELIAASHEPVSPAEVAFARGTSSQSAGQTLLGLLARGLVHRVGHGYVLADPVEEAA